MAVVTVHVVVTCHWCGQPIRLTDHRDRLPAWFHRLSGAISCANPLNLGPGAKAWPLDKDGRPQFSRKSALSGLPVVTVWVHPPLALGIPMVELVGWSR